MVTIRSKSAAEPATTKVAVKATTKGATKAKAAKTPKAPRAPKEPTEHEKRAALAAKHPEKLVREWNERCGGRVRGVTTGLGVEAAWCYLFERNAKAPVADRMTDAQISAFLKKEFPGKKGRENKPTSVFEADAVQATRSKFNRGAFGEGYKPEKPSQPWDGTAWLEVKRGRKPGAGAVVRKPKSDGVPSAKGFGGLKRKAPAAAAAASA